jgi:hypothetical protein
MTYRIAFALAFAFAFLVFVIPEGNLLFVQAPTDTPNLKMLEREIFVQLKHQERMRRSHPRAPHFFAHRLVLFNGRGVRGPTPFNNPPCKPAIDISSIGIITLCLWPIRKTP